MSVDKFQQQGAENGHGPTITDHDDSNGKLVLEEDSVATPTLTVVMPTLNEEEGIAECIERIQNAFQNLGVQGEILVSDSSTDQTPEIAREMGAIVVEPDQPGYGYAYQYAFERARGEYIAIGDADTTYDFEELPKLYDLVADGDADMAMGSRLEGDILPGSMPKLHQYVGNPGLTAFLNAFYGAGVSDAHSGMRVISKDALEQLDLKTDGMEFASEMIMEAGAQDLTIEEVPITYHPREGEATLESFSDGWRHVRFMLVNAPGYLYSVPGLVMSLLGLLTIGVAFSSLNVGGVTLGPHSMVAGGLMLIVGYQVASLGAFARVAGNPIRKPDDPITNWVLERVNLERGVTIGAAVFLAGAAYTVYLFSQWVLSGFTTLPMFTGDVLAFTAMVLGVQVVFSAFFLSTINN